MRNVSRIFYVPTALLVLFIALIGLQETPVAYADTITVTSTDDVLADDGFCTLREAVIAANTDTASGEAQGECPAGSDADTITLAPGATYLLTLRTNVGDFCSASSIMLLCVESEATIQGNGATISGDSQGGVLQTAGDITINDLTISGGTGLGGLFNTSNLVLNGSTVSGNVSEVILGGGITNTGVAELNNSTVRQNHLTGTRGSAGGIKNFGGALLTLNNSTVSGNDTRSSDNSAGGIYNGGGTVTLNSSTVSGNLGESDSQGGGIFNKSGTVTLISSTVSRNKAQAGTGIFSSGGELILKNTIVAGNFTGVNDCLLENGAVITSHGHNLIGDGSGCDFAPGAGDQVGTAENPIDALLDPLADNGGPTETHAPVQGSPVIDAGSCAGSTLDQRGLPRPSDVGGVDNVDDGCDIGALEAQFEFTVSIADGDVDGLLSALLLTGSAIGLSTIELAEHGDYVLEEGELLVSRELLIDGNGATIRRSGDEDTPEFRILHVTPTGDLTLNGLTVSNGLVTPETPQTDDRGGGIWNQRGVLNIENSTVSENTALSGGGILNDRGTLTITASTISENEATDSTGGVISSGTLRMTNSTISGNILGGILISNGDATIVNSTIVSNPGGTGITNSATAVLANTIVAHHISGSSSDCDPVSEMTSDGFNIDTDATCNLTHPDDFPLTVPFIGALLNSGGPTETHAPSAGSPAIDAIPPEDCIDGQGQPLRVDQRGVERPQSEGCDIGAVEIRPAIVGDFNCDAIVNILDAVWLLQFIVRLLPTLGNCGGF